MRSVLSNSRAASSLHVVPPPVLILCADEGVAQELIRELAGRRYQPLVGRPGWSWKAALEWARPVAAVVDTKHPAAGSDGFLAASDDLDVGLVVFGGPANVAARPQRGRGKITTDLTADARLHGGGVGVA